GRQVRVLAAGQPRPLRAADTGGVSGGRPGRRTPSGPRGRRAGQPVRWGMSAPWPASPVPTSESSISKNSGSGAPPASRSRRTRGGGAAGGPGGRDRVVVELPGEEDLMGRALDLAEQLV